MKTKILLLVIFLLLLLSTSVFSQEILMNCVASDDPPGNRLPSIGAVNVLIVFAQFPDDNYQKTDSIWVKGQPPSDMNSWINQTWTSNPIQGSLTHYFNDMSYNQLKLTGKTVSVIAPYTRKYYMEHSEQRWDIHSDILEQLDASGWDFGEFDNWDDSRHNTSDGIVDMIIFVWRNISNDYPSQPIDSIYIVKHSLDFDDDRGGIGGVIDTLNVDGGLRKIIAWDLHSGVTIRDYVANGKAQTFRIVVHEFAHYLLGGNDYHSGFGFWGMLASYGVKCIVANSFERERLGWINLTNKTYTSGSPDQLGKTLGDYVTTGDAYKFVISANPPKQCFYIENHQKLNYWETHNTFGNIENGVYLLRMDDSIPSDFSTLDPYRRNSGNFRCIPASGRYDWTVNQLHDNPWGSGTLPVFRNLGPDRVNGDHDLNYLSWTWGGVNQNKEAIYFTEDE